jgi:hypothetical protein
MPYLHLDVPAHYPLTVKRDLAQRLGGLYGKIMETSSDLVDVSIRELGEGGVWHCSAGGPEPTAVLSCEIRRGRPPEQRERLGEALHGACVEILGLNPERLSVEFTQHAGDEIYLKVMNDGVLQGGLGADWTPAEATTSMMETLKAARRAAP